MSKLETPGAADETPVFFPHLLTPRPVMGSVMGGMAPGVAPSRAGNNEVGLFSQEG